MQNLIIFVAEHYAIFLTITIVLIFALIGYIYDSKKGESLIGKVEEELSEESLENLVVPEGKSLAETVNISKNINPETRSVELLDNDILSDTEQNTSKINSP